MGPGTSGGHLIGYKRTLGIVGCVLAVPLLTGAEGEGCGGAVNSMSPAPNTEGDWDITYQDTIDVEVKLGDSVYNGTLPAEGGSFTVDHEGVTIPFEIDCSREEVVCPNEGWPETVSVEQRNDTYPHRMWVTLPRQKCSGELVDPAPEKCGPDTNNPDCDQVCEGEVVTEKREVFGVIDEAGESFDLLLGAGIASNGVNCAMLGVSAAEADLVTTGTAEGGDWRAEGMENGEVTVGYAGGCLWAREGSVDGSVEALILGGSIKFTNGFTGARVE